MKHRTMLFRCGAVERLSYPESCDAADDGDSDARDDILRIMHAADDAAAMKTLAAKSALPTAGIHAIQVIAIIAIENACLLGNDRPFVSL